MNLMSTSIIIFGETAVGKLTVAKIVARKLKYKLSHNHLSYDLVFSLFERGSKRAAYLIEPMRYVPYIEAAEEGISFVTTHTYSHDFISQTGQSDPEYLLKLEEGLIKANSKPYFIFLTASNEEILKRVTHIDREKHGKLTNKEVMKEILKERAKDIAPPVSNLKIIDNSHQSAEEVANEIVSFVSAA